MTKLLIIAGALAWGLWWFAGAFHGPMQQNTVTYGVTEQGAFQRDTTYGDATQRAYRHAVQTPATANDWLGRIRHSTWSWQWWAVGCAPLGLALFFVAREL